MSIFLSNGRINFECGFKKEKSVTLLCFLAFFTARTLKVCAIRSTCYSTIWLQRQKRLRLLSGLFSQIALMKMFFGGYTSSNSTHGIISTIKS